MPERLAHSHALRGCYATTLSGERVPIQSIKARLPLIQVLNPPDAGKRKTPRPGWNGGAYAFMRRVLATDHGGELYGKRQGIIEPVFANTKFNRRIDRFQRPGRSAARSDLHQWVGRVVGAVLVMRLRLPRRAET